MHISEHKTIFSYESATKGTANDSSVGQKKQRLTGKDSARQKLGQQTRDSYSGLHKEISGSGGSKPQTDQVNSNDTGKRQSYEQNTKANSTGRQVEQEAGRSSGTPQTGERFIQNAQERCPHYI